MSHAQSPSEGYEALVYELMGVDPIAEDFAGYDENEPGA